MKKLYFILAFILVSFVMVFASETIKLLRIYHNGTFTIIPLASIDSIDHSKNDANGNLMTNYTYSVFETIDTTYNIPISEIDSLVVTEADIEEYNTNIEAVKQRLIDQDELPVDQYQKKLLEWLNNCDFVAKSTLTDLKDKIIVEFQNGMDYYINFIDLSHVSDDGNEDMTEARIIKTGNPDDVSRYYDVSSDPDEEIVNPNILIIQCRTMPSKIKSYFSNADSEWERLYKTYEDSPIDGKKYKIKRINKSFSFIGENYSNYGLVIISQTHGDLGRSGKFQVEDESEMWRKLKGRGIKKGKNVYITLGDNPVCHTAKEDIYWFSPEYLRSKMTKKLVYGSYCYSIDLQTKFNNATVYGYKSPVWYDCPGNPRKYPTSDSLIVRIERFLNGVMYKDALWLKSYNAEGDVQIPAISKPDSKQRYFSISTDSITKTGERSQPIISGKINGYDNLKKDDLTYLLYFHEGLDKFSPELAIVEECIPLRIPGSNEQSAIEVNDDGSFSFEFPGLLKTNTKYKMIFAFEYNNRIYYGETKYILPEEKNDTITEGALVDLGLSVKWASCNVGASTPSQLGIKANIDFLSEAYDAYPELFNLDATWADFRKSEYDFAYKYSGGKMWMPSYDEMKELREKCTWELFVVDGIAGARVVGPNKNSIFLPAKSIKSEMPVYGDFYTMDYTIYTSGTYDEELGWGPMCFYIFGSYVPKMAPASNLLFDYCNDFEAYIRPVGR